MLYVIIGLEALIIGLQAALIGILIKKVNILIEKNNNSITVIESKMEENRKQIIGNVIVASKKIDNVAQNQSYILNDRFNKIDENLNSIRIDNDLFIAKEQFTPYIATFSQVSDIIKNGEKIGEINPGEFVTIVFEKDGYGELLSGEGMVDLSFVIRNPVKRNNMIPATVKEMTELRNGPGQGFTSIGTIKIGAKVEIFNTIGNWGHVNVEKGPSGFILLSTLSQG